MRSYVISDTFFKAIAEKGGLYSRLWFYWLSCSDDITEPDFLAKQKRKYKTSEINEVYNFGLQLLRDGHFKIIYHKNKKIQSRIDKKTRAVADAVIDYLNEKAGTTFLKKGKNITLIADRIKEGHTIGEFKRVIDSKVNDWKGTDYEKYIRPITLFKSKFFENYLNAKKIHATPTKFDQLTDTVASAARVTKSLTIR